MTETTAPAKMAAPWQRIFFLILLALVLVTGSFYLTNKRDTETIVVTFPSGREIDAEVADTPEKILFGLAFRDALPMNAGMLYIFETSDFHRVRTKAFRFPVDIVWVDESHHVVHMVERAEPCSEDPCPAYGPPSVEARYIIETAVGLIKQEELQPGTELKFTLRL
jgi:uncharacterized membrane protein (UPF0127 family)